MLVFKSFPKKLGCEAKLVVEKCARGEGQPVELSSDFFQNLGVAVAKVLVDRIEIEKSLVINICQNGSSA